MFRFINGRTVNEPIKQGDGLEPQGGNAAPQASKNRRVRVDVPIQVSYQTDVDLALKIMEAAARAHPRVLTDPAPLAMLKAFADSGIDLELYAWIKDPEAGKGNLRSDLNRALWKSFAANGIAIPFPQREVRIIDGKNC